MEDHKEVAASVYAVAKKLGIDPVEYLAAQFVYILGNAEDPDPGPAPQNAWDFWEGVVRALLPSPEETWVLDDGSPTNWDLVIKDVFCEGEVWKVRAYDWGRKTTNRYRIYDAAWFVRNAVAEDEG